MKITLEIDDTRFEEKLISAIANVPTGEAKKGWDISNHTQIWKQNRSFYGLRHKRLQLGQLDCLG